MTTGFPHLLAPGRIGAMAVRNRVVMSPMETMYRTPDGQPSQRTRDFFAARAKGGVGLITLGATVKPRHANEIALSYSVPVPRWPGPPGHRFHSVVGITDEHPGRKGNSR